MFLLKYEERRHDELRN